MRVMMAVAVLTATRPALAAGPTAGSPALRRIVRSLADGTVAGPVFDAIASIGPNSFWATLGPLLVGGAAVLLLALGPVLGMVVVLWTYRRLRWLFWLTVGAVATLLRWVADRARLLVGRGGASGVEEVSVGSNAVDSGDD
jgi:hypothetical protein